MAIKSRHPTFLLMEEKWTLGRDSYLGSSAIKAKGPGYLPATPGQVEDGAGGDAKSIGEVAYQTYKLRSVYPELYKEAVEAIIGIMHRKPPTIELPTKLEAMRDSATRIGESLQMVLRNINVQQLITGRVGILGDITTKDSVVTPILTLFKEKAILNWDDTIDDEEEESAMLRLVVLDESGFELEAATLLWKQKERYLILSLVDAENKPARRGLYAAAIVENDDEVSGAEYKIPNLAGKKLEVIPFTFINSKDISPTPDMPPLESIANSCLVIYRGEADYRQNLFMQGQDTLVLIGGQPNDSAVDGGESTRVGAGSVLNVPQGGDAKYVGVSSTGLMEQRESLQNDYARALSKSGQIMDATSRARESGDALRLRVSAQTATLPQIAKAGAAGLEKTLKDLAVWIGADPEKVSVIPNTDFTNDELNGKTIVDIMTAKNLGAPISQESIHARMAENGMTDFTYDQELELILKEEPSV